jgi:stearoyl-CoA desaturase (delta-9 desaturase)
MAYGILDLSLWGYVVVGLVLTHITIASVTIFLHRHQAHRALDLHPLASHFFRFWLWLTTGMITREWVAVHRKHHAKCETAEDPHSPQILGLNRILWGGVSLYQATAAQEKTLAKYGRGTPDDWLERNLYSAHQMAGILLMLFVDLVLFGVLPGALIWGAQMAWIPFWAAGVINGVGHYWGYRSYETADASTNIVPWGIIIGGEELHNNHHAYASSARLSSKWWEIDIGWLYIRILQAFGLAHVKRVAPDPLVLPHKGILDTDAVAAIATHRFQVMATYARHVIVPVLKEELRRADDSCREVYRRARSWLVRSEALLDEKSKAELETVLASSSKLRTVYHFKQRLQALWQRSATTQEAMVQSVHDWCRQAEAAGVGALREFARGLRGCSLTHA